MIFYIFTLIQCSVGTGSFLHKVDRMYTYYDSQIIYYKCPQQAIDMYLYIQTETAFELVIGNVSNKQAQLERKHCIQINDLVIQYGQCQSLITVIVTSQFSLFQGDIKIHTLDDLQKNGNYRSHRLNFVNFFKFEIPSNSIIYIEIKLLLEITYTFDLLINQESLPTFKNQSHHFMDATSAIKYVFVRPATYYIIVTCGRNFDYLLKVQEYGQSQFLFLPNNSSTDNLLMQLFGIVANVYFKTLLGSFTICFSDDISNCQYIKMDNITNQNYIAPSRMTIISIESEFILVYYQSLSTLIEPCNSLTFIINQEYQLITIIQVYNHFILQFDSQLLQVNKYIMNTCLQYAILPIIPTNFTITQVNVTLQDHYQPHNMPQVLLFPADSQIEIHKKQNIFIKRIYGSYQIVEKHFSLTLLMLTNCILLFHHCNSDNAQLIDLDYHYKSINQSATLYISILSHNIVEYQIFPIGIQHEIIYHNKSHSISNNSLQFHNIKAIQLTSKVQYFYLIFCLANKMIYYLTKSSLVFQSTQNILIAIQQSQYIPVIQYFVINSRESEQIYLKTIDDKLITEGQPMMDLYFLTTNIHCQLFLYVDEQQSICTYLYDNKYTQMNSNSYYCLLVQQNLINFISLNLTIVELLINVQPLDQQEQILYPNLEQFHYKISFGTNEIVDLSFQDCLQFDCLLKIKNKPGIQNNSYFKFRNCYYNDNYFQHLGFEQSIDLCNSTNLYSILQIYGTIQLHFQTELQCASDECYFIIQEIQCNLNYPLNITNLNYCMNQNERSEKYLRYGTPTYGNMIIYSNDSFISTSILYRFDKTLYITSASFIMSQYQDFINFSSNKQLYSMICVDYGNFTIQNIFIINNKGINYCTIFSFNLIQNPSFSINAQSTFTIQFTYTKYFQVYLNQLNEFTSSNKASYFFYNPESQSIIIHSNVAFNLLNLESTLIMTNESIIRLHQGFYKIICLQEQSYVYFTAFTQATNLYNNITFTTIGQRNWNIFNKSNKRYIIIQLQQLNQNQVSFQIRGNYQYLDILNNMIILEFQQSEEIITSNGNFLFRAVYVDQLCLPLQLPRFSQLQNYKYEISGQINELCQLQFIELYYNDSMQKCLSCLNFRFEFEIELDQQVEIQLRSKVFLIIQVISNEYTISQVLLYSCCELNNALINSEFRAKVLLVLVFTVCIYIIYTTSMKYNIRNRPIKLDNDLD